MLSFIIKRTYKYEKFYMRRDLKHINDVICACCILHNLCIDYNCNYEDVDNAFIVDTDNIQINREDSQGHGEISNKLIRDALCNL